MRHFIDILTESRKTFTQADLAKYFTSPVLYKKYGEVNARLATKDEIIATIIDGKVETINTAGDDDVVIRGSQDEEYILDRTKFLSRYKGPELNGDYLPFRATGTTYAVEWQHGEGRFKASWGEIMIIDDGDWLCSITSTPDGDLYRIAATAFDDTYVEVEEDDDQDDA